jgi:hypothetical protein
MHEKIETLEIYTWDMTPLEFASTVAKYMEAEAQKPGFDPKQYKIRHNQNGGYINIIRKFDYRG